MGLSEPRGENIFDLCRNINDDENVASLRFNQYVVGDYSKHDFNSNREWMHFEVCVATFLVLTYNQVYI